MQPSSVPDTVPSSFTHVIFVTTLGGRHNDCPIRGETEAQRAGSPPKVTQPAPGSISFLLWPGPCPQTFSLLSDLRFLHPAVFKGSWGPGGHSPDSCSSPLAASAAASWCLHWGKKMRGCPNLGSG